MDIIKKIIICLWCFPSFLVGSFVYLYSKLIRRHCIKRKYEGITFYEVDNDNFAYGVSLCPFIFLAERNARDKIDIHHEYGHIRQAYRLGWLYLILIGIPSGSSNLKFLNKIIRGREHNTKYQYYHEFVWERSADRLGGVYHIINEKEKTITRTL